MKKAMIALVVLASLALVANAGQWYWQGTAGEGCNTWDMWNRNPDGSGAAAAAAGDLDGEDLVMDGAAAWGLVTTNLTYGTFIVSDGANLTIQDNGHLNNYLVDGGAFGASTQYSNDIQGTLELSGAGLILTGDAFVPERLTVEGVVSGTGGIEVVGGIHKLTGINTFDGGIAVRNGGAVASGLGVDWAGSAGAVNLDGGGMYWMDHNGGWTNTNVSFYGGNGGVSSHVIFGTYGTTGSPLGGGGNKNMIMEGQTISAGPMEGGDGTGLMTTYGAIHVEDNSDGTVNGRLLVSVGDGTADKIMALADGSGSFDLRGDDVDLVLNLADGWTDGTYTIIERNNPDAWLPEAAFFANDDGTGLVTGVTPDGVGFTCEVVYDNVPGGGTIDNVIISNIQTFQSYLPGDADKDLDVDGTDLAAVGLNWSPAGLDKLWADGNFTLPDGVAGNVDGSDLAAVGLNWSPAGYGAAGVPEPASLCLLAAGAVALMRRKR